MTAGVKRTLFQFLNRLDGKGIHYTLEHNSEQAVMVLVAVPGTRFEVEFFLDGHVEVERFVSTGEIEGPTVLDEILRS